MIPENEIQNEDHQDDDYGDEFDFVEAYDETPVNDDLLLPENTAVSAINCAFIGVGGGGGKLAKAFLDIGFNKTMLLNTTVKDQPNDVPAEHFLLLPGADGVGKDIALGKKVLIDNGARVEDACRQEIGNVDWIFVLAGGGGGTGSACAALHKPITRYLDSIEATGRVVYVVTKPTGQELLNPTIATNYKSLLKDVTKYPHIVIDNEKQLHLLRGKIGMLNMYPSANKNFAKLFSQVLKLAAEKSPIQTFDSKDLERCLKTPGRIIIGSTVIKDPYKQDLGAAIYSGCHKSSPCPAPNNNSKTGVLLLLLTEEIANNPDISKRLESGFSYVGGRAETLFSGVYVKNKLPGLVAIALFGGNK